MSSAPLLFDPIALRDLTVRNRLWTAPMCQYSVEDRDGVPTDWHLVHLGQFATGGFGLVMTEATAVAPEGRISPQDTGLWNRAQADGWGRITSFAHAQGAAIGVQLAHAGRKASTPPPFRPGAVRSSRTLSDAEGGWPTVGPSPVAFPGHRTPDELGAGEIEGIVAAFAEAARRADQAGFDLVELHAAHGYLLHQFLSPVSNGRTDAWGGTLQKRMRLMLDVTEAVRAVWPAHKPLSVRVSATDWAPAGWDEDDTVALAIALKTRGVDLIDVSTGGNLAPGVPNGPRRMLRDEIPQHPGYQVAHAGQVRRGADVPVAAVGLITTPEQAEQVLATEHADVVMMGREALRDPHVPQRAAGALGADRKLVTPPQYWRSLRA